MPHVNGHLENSQSRPSPLNAQGDLKSDIRRRPTPWRSLIAALLLLTVWTCGLVATGRFSEDLAHRVAPGLELQTLARALGLTMP